MQVNAKMKDKTSVNALLSPTFEPRFHLTVVCWKAASSVMGIFFFLCNAHNVLMLILSWSPLLLGSPLHFTFGFFFFPTCPHPQLIQDILQVTSFSHVHTVQGPVWTWREHPKSLNAVLQISPHSLVLVCKDHTSSLRLAHNLQTQSGVEVPFYTYRTFFFCFFCFFWWEGK